MNGLSHKSQRKTFVESGDTGDEDARDESVPMVVGVVSVLPPDSSEDDCSEKGLLVADDAELRVLPSESVPEEWVEKGPLAADNAEVISPSVSFKPVDVGDSLIVRLL